MMVSTQARFAVALAAIVASGCNPSTTPTPSRGKAPAIGAAALGAPTTTILPPPATRLAQPTPRVTLPATLTEPWFGLTASDGTGLAISKLTVRTVIAGPLAFTQLDIDFRNDQPRVREGKFRITLPEGAALSRFAMTTDGTLREAEVVEKQLARRAYEDFLHRRQDPALLEQAAGNVFAARVFPIAANAEKHLVLSFSQELRDPRSGFRLPLVGLPQLGALDASVQMLGQNGTFHTTATTKRKWVPDADLLVTGDAPNAVMAGTLMAMRVPVVIPQAEAARPDALTIMIDTSASRALGLASEISWTLAMVTQLRDSLGAATPLQIIAFDQTAQTVFTGTLGSLTTAALDGVRTRGAAGASDLGQALALISRAQRRQVIVISDGIVTAGLQNQPLLAAVQALQPRGVQRLDMVITGGVRDSAAALALTRALPTVGTVLDIAALGVVETSQRLTQTMALDVPVRVHGAQWQWPRTISAQSGDNVMVYASFDKAPGNVTVAIGKATALATECQAPAALLSNSLARAHIAELEAALATSEVETARSQARTKLVALSTQSRVLSSVTSMLVLESDADYARFGIATTNLADLLVIDQRGLTLLHRSSPPPAQLATAKVPPAPVAATSGKLEVASSPPATTADDESGGTGTAMALDEGKMGRRDASSATDRDGQANANSDGESFGRGGLSIGAASGSGSIGQGRYGTIGHGAGTGTGYGVGAGRGGGGRVQTIGLADNAPAPSGPAPLIGELATIQALLIAKKLPAALAAARRWHQREPGNVLALIALGDALEAQQLFDDAARTYGSIIDLFPDRADLRRFAGQRLARLATPAALNLMIDTYQHAVADRPDHPSSHRLLAYALARNNQLSAAFAALETGLRYDYPADRFNAVKQVMLDDLGLLGAAWAAAEPTARDAIVQRMHALGASLATAPSTRFVLYWETDANDVDFHIYDARGGHAFYSDPALASGGSLYGDVTTGYGPECFVIPGRASAGPYRISINYYAMGPMGYGMGAVEILRHDGQGKLAFETRNFVVMVDQAFVELGTIK